MFEIGSELVLPRRREEIFPFFSDAGNLEILTPEWLRFEVLTPQPIELGANTLINYRLRLRGVPIRWTSEITVWEPPQRFVDEQRSGPYKIWIHEHRFEERSGSTLVIDHVRYDHYGGTLVNRLFVAPDLEKIFAYRRQKLVELFGPADSAGSAGASQMNRVPDH